MRDSYCTVFEVVDGFVSQFCLSSALYIRGWLSGVNFLIQLVLSHMLLCLCASIVTTNFQNYSVITLINVTGYLISLCSH